MKRKIRVHIDDIGVSENFSNDVFNLISKGLVDSVSILITGAYWKESLLKLKQLSHPFKFSLHLNLSEGYSLTTSPYLTNSSGEFNISFLKLVLLSLPFAPTKKKRLVQHEIREEFKAQILRLKSEVPELSQLSIDSHRHIHLVPCVFDVLLTLSREFNISHIRIIQEPFFIKLYPIKNTLAYLNGNLIKHILLNFFSSIALKKLKKENLTQLHNQEEFLGVLFSDLMDHSNILSGIQKTSKNVIILFHAGRLLPNEKYLGTNKKFKAYYSSKNRLDEINTLQSNEFKTILHTYR